jgi:uncharacterized protein (TIGR01619 family)
MRNIFIVVIFLLIASKSWSQTGKWDVYMAQYENGPGSTTLNMDLIKLAPKKELSFILITGVTTENCRDDGFPNSVEFERLYKVSDAVEARLKELTKFELSGSFTYQCERLDYIYVRDSISLRTELTKLYKTEFPDFKYYINIKADADWETYLQFLYPNEETQEFMANEKVLAQLRQAGDDLSKPRQVDHWLYFTDKANRSSFLESIEKEGFKVEGEDKLKDSTLPFQLHISRTDNVNPGKIYKVTLSLRRKAKIHNGEYDGWETFVITE